MFSLFIDELVTYFNRNDVKGIQIHPDTIQFFAIMFADDIALISDIVRGLQMQLNLLYSFADEYKLTVNEQKTNIVVFKNEGTLARAERWHYNNTPLEVVNQFCYVGLAFSRQMSTNVLVSELCVKGKRLLISILSSLYNCGQLSKHVFF